MSVTAIHPIGVELTLRAGEALAQRLRLHLGCKRLLGIQIEADDRHVVLRVTEDHGHGATRLRTVRAAADVLGVPVQTNGHGMRWCNGEFGSCPVLVVTHLAGEVVR